MDFSMWLEEVGEKNAGIAECEENSLRAFRINTPSTLNNMDISAPQVLYTEAAIISFTDMKLLFLYCPGYWKKTRHDLSGNALNFQTTKDFGSGPDKVQHVH